MIWKTDTPTEDVIVAKLTDEFCGGKGRYAILSLGTEEHFGVSMKCYMEDFEEVPYAAIEKWASLKEETDIEPNKVLYYGLQGSVGITDKKCSLCGETMIWQDDRVYLSNPPMYGYKCPKCGNVEFEIIKVQ